MTEWKAKRFWTKADVAQTGEGWEVRLDDRPLKTPLKSDLVVPTEALARAMAAEWEAQEEEIKPLTMPVTRTANSAIEKVATQFDAVAEMLADYGETDLICYRAEAPEGLIAAQSEGWDPLLLWAKSALGAELKPATGVMFEAQDQRALDRLTAQVKVFSPFQLAAFHDLVTLSGSLILAFAVTEGVRTPEEAWALSRIDEEWQIAEWGRDEEAAASTEARREAFLHAARFFSLTTPD